MGRKAPYILCRRNEDFEEISIKNVYFLLIVLRSGKLFLSVGNDFFPAEGPCCICFDEREEPNLEKAEEAEYFCIYFRPEFLNANLTFDFLRDCSFGDVGQLHEVFWLSPFLEKRMKGPIEGNVVSEIWQTCEVLYEEMEKKQDVYWHYRCRSLFMEILMGLEKMAELSKRMSSIEVTAAYISDKRIREAILYIEQHCKEKVELKDVAASCGLNPTTLMASFKREMKLTIMDYVMCCRIREARRLLRKEKLSIKEIAAECGFKTQAHFGRIFKEWQKETPGEFRQRQLQKEKERRKGV